MPVCSCLLEKILLDIAACLPVPCVDAGWYSGLDWLSDKLLNAKPDPDDRRTLRDMLDDVGVLKVLLERLEWDLLWLTEQAVLNA